MPTIVGIDLGTTNSGVAVWRDGEPEMIPDAEGRRLTPSVVALDAATGRWVVGARAREIALRDPKTAVYSIKRFIGRRYSDAVVQEALKRGHILYEIDESEAREDGIAVTLQGRDLTPQEVSAKILQKLKDDAEAFLGHRVKQAVITVPAYFHAAQRQATRDAGRLAGLHVPRVLSEPTAACLAFGFRDPLAPRHNVAVYDLGGGTFDISLLEVGRGPFRVRSTNGDTHLGGDDVDWAIVDWVLPQLAGGDPAQIRSDAVAMARLRAAAERAKIALSSSESARVYVAGPLSPTPDMPDVDLVLTREMLEGLVKDWIDRSLAPCEQALRDARLRPDEIEEVLMVGGQTRMPAIRKAVAAFFDAEPNVSVNPDEVVALGAAVQAAILAGETTGLHLADVVPLSLGVATKGYMDTVIPRNAPVPIKQTKSYTTEALNQTEARIEVYQGEMVRAADNTRLASLVLKGMLPSASDKPVIDVTFQIDQDSILHVTARDRETGNEQALVITNHIQMSDDEIQDKIEAQAEELVRQLRAALSGVGDLPGAGDLNQALVDEIHHALDALDAAPAVDWVAQLDRLRDLWRRIALSPETPGLMPN